MHKYTINEVFMKNQWTHLHKNIKLCIFNCFYKNIQGILHIKKHKTCFYIADMLKYFMYGRTKKMNEQYQKRKRHKRNISKVLVAFLSIVIVIACALGSAVVIEYFTDNNKSGLNSDTSSIIEKPDEPEPIIETSTATVAVTGDLLMHLPIITGAYDSTSKEYNFDNIFTYFSEYVSKADYSIANLETTLRGTEGGATYKGYPTFNCPDSIADSVKKAGFDMLLTANNHSYDTALKGFKRTLEVATNGGLECIGTMTDESSPKYVIKEINGIKIGMICYTYQTGDGSDNRVYLNGIKLSNEATNLVNSFSYSQLDKFYTEMDTHITSMKQSGADAVVLYIHWGEEYKVKENKTQNQIAQKLCNLGVDLIVGGHPHVIEPIELLTSETDSNHKTVCLYSLGNAVSNQRRERMNLNTGHTEDGMLFSYTFSKYSDGTVVLKDVNVLPAWVNLFTSKETGRKVYQIIPLDDTIKDNWKVKFNLSDKASDEVAKSYTRTMDIVGEGLNEVKDYLANQITPDKLKKDIDTSY